MADVNAKELINRARSHVHTLGGLLTGVSASLYCSKIAADKQSADSHIEESEKLTEEAGRELAQIRDILRELDQISRK